MNTAFDYDHMIEILTALKEDKDVQYRTGGVDDWILHNKDDLPKFHFYVYRIKPDVVRCKVGLFKDETNFTYTDIIQEYAIRRCELDDASFVRWLTDWIEYESQL